MRSAILAVAMLALTACNRAPTRPAPAETPSPAAALPPAPVPSPAPAPADTASPAAQAPSASRDPQAVLIAWAKAVSLRDWATVRGYWGDHGARSGLSEAQFAARWSALKDPSVDIGKGEQEGAAGSSFYTAPVTIRDGARTIAGEVVIRRVNDVVGASAEQLRWHIESTTLKI